MMCIAVDLQILVDAELHDVDVQDVADTAIVVVDVLLVGKDVEVSH